MIVSLKYIPHRHISSAAFRARRGLLTSQHALLLTCQKAKLHLSQPGSGSSACRLYYALIPLISDPLSAAHRLSASSRLIAAFFFRWQVLSCRLVSLSVC